MLDLVFLILVGWAVEEVLPLGSMDLEQTVASHAVVQTPCFGHHSLDRK